MVEFVDGSVKAELGTADMRVPIQYALCYPKRTKNRFPKLDLTAQNLEFYPPDTDRFECLSLAYIAGKVGGTLPTVLNAANEVAVGAFLNRELSFIDIPRMIEKVMERHKVKTNPDLNAIIEADGWARKEAKEEIKMM